MDYYFSPSSSPVRTLVAASSSASAACPFSGHYAIGGPAEAVSGLLSGSNDPANEASGCLRASTSMQAGCSGSSGLRVDTRCDQEVDNR